MDHRGPQPCVGVAFHVYVWSELPVRMAAARLRMLVPLPLVRHQGSLRGEYYRWSGDGGADLLLQENVPDENGRPMEPDAPAHAVLIYATGLQDDVHTALATSAGVRVLSADVVPVPCAPWPVHVVRQPIGSM